MGGSGRSIAFFGSMTLLARELRSALERRAFPAVDVKLFDTAEDGTITEFAGEALVVTTPDEESIFNLDIAFMCGTASDTAPYLDWPSRRGYVAIDLSGASLTRPGVPLVHTEINPGDVASGGNGLGAQPIIGSPHPVSHNLASIASAARRAGRLADLQALALRPVSDMGEKGIDELYRQTVALLSFASVPQEVFGRQIAFNLLPSSSMAGSRAEGFDARIQVEAERMLGDQPASLSITSAFVPIFHGHTMAVTLGFERPPELGALREALGSTRGIRLLDDPASCSPVELAGEQSVALFNLMPDAHRPGRVSLWAFCDNLKGGAALNAVRIAERVSDLRREGR